MRIVVIVLFVLAIGTGAFAWWGLFTIEGRQSYDEMAGMVPLASGLISTISFVAGTIAFAVSGRSGRKSPRGFPIEPPTRAG